jgi:hypothetical protein
MAGWLNRSLDEFGHTAEATGTGTRGAWTRARLPCRRGAILYAVSRIILLKDIVSEQYDVLLSGLL